ncbi:benzodiazepine receptor TspO [Flavobacterium saliperosum S13]|uniref:TspO and MBR related proteins n=2 Tax=Flavobacterium saliperosum TaxID=329186 RepID=A0A1G4VWS5_9FLAO|nr:TspO/MBR family protein [Flavobacterium saliperosum]ESU26811.1 benzodiazepine receptor TspO [Flavobacterium saliperosum S13]SCX13152.1 TspO and MBR related proteins [Flavobacterium saliperosum]
MNKITRILTVVVTCLCIGYFSGIITRESIEVWYPTLVKPGFNPPNWIFAPVWSALYVMMGIAAGMVWNRIETDRINVRKGLRFFAIQLALNFLWSYLFFGLHNPLLALVELIVLWLMIFETYVVFKKVDKIAGMLLLPYLGWVTFAGILNAAIFWLNR